MKKVYLDYAAATPMDERVVEAMRPYFTEYFYNPSALYLDSKAVARDVAEARARVAGHLGVRPGEIIFTAGGTEANNLAIQGVMQHFPDANLVVSAIEHESVLMPARNYSVKEAPVTSDGLLDLASFEQLIDDRTALVSIMYANNEVGSMQSLKKISDLLIKLRKIRSLNGNHLPLYFHSDGCQAGNYLDLHVHKSGVDLMTLNGGKIYGPKQSGVLYVNAGVRFKPQILGGGQERGWRSGTENIAGIVGFAKALDIAQAARQDETRRLQDLQQAFFKLLARHVPEAVINGSLKHRLPNNVHITIPGQDNERLVMAMDEAGIQCAAGSACSAGSEEPSHVLKAMGFTDDAARNSLRFTMGRYTGEKELQYTVETLAKIIA